MSSLDDSGFASAKVEDDRGFDAAQYEFFNIGGDETIGGLEDDLEGALEEGLEAPPAEEMLGEGEFSLGGDEDLGYASMFAEALGRSKSPPSPDVSASVTGDQLDERYESKASASKYKAGSIALGGLLTASTPSDSTFGSFRLSSEPNNPLGLPFALASRQGQIDTSAVQPPESGLAGSTHRPPTGQLTPFELEAQLMHPGSGNGHISPSFQRVPAYSQQSMGKPVPPPYAVGPPQGPQRQAGVFTPEMIMMMQQQQQQTQANTAQTSGQEGQALSQFPPLPVNTPAAISQGTRVPLGVEGAPGPMMPPHPGMLPPPPPGMHLPPFGGAGTGARPMMGHVQPGIARPGGFAVQGLPVPNHSAMMAAPGRPLGFTQFVASKGFDGQRSPHVRPATASQQPSFHHPHASLAQRLRALNLADRGEPSHGTWMRRRLRNSQYMAAEEIDSILGMQWRSLYQGNPYVEDYYYQAFLYKYYGHRNKRTFAPDSVRELAPTEKVAADQVAFVKLEGLGRVPFSNIRRPRPLMDVTPDDLRTTTSSVDGDHVGSPKESSQKPLKRLGQEPMLAARIMVEDCMALILDVQDIDRIFVATAGRPLENHMELLQRRCLLVDGLAASLRIPETAMMKETMKDASGYSDGIFLRLLALVKGRTLIGRALQQLYPPPEASGESTMGKKIRQEPNLRILWATLRNIRAIFNIKVRSSGKAFTEKENAIISSTSRLAEAAADVIRQLHTRDALLNAYGAFMSGDFSAETDDALLPLFAPGESIARKPHLWLADVLVALLQRSAELDLTSGTMMDKDSSKDGKEAETFEKWREFFKRLQDIIDAHLGVLQKCVQEAVAQGDQERVKEVKEQVPVALVRSLLQLCSDEDATIFKSYLTKLTIC